MDLIILGEGVTGLSQMARFFEDFEVPSTGLPRVGGSVTIYREGATVNGNQSGTEPFTVNVHDNGKVVNTDLVFVNTTTGTTYTVDSFTDTSLVLSGFMGTLSLTNGDRLIASGGLPVLFSDDQGIGPTANPLTTDSNGLASCWMQYGFYDYIVTGGGGPTTLFVGHPVGVAAEPLPSIFQALFNAAMV